MEYRGDEYLYDAISGLGHNLAGAIDAYAKRYQQTKVMDAEMQSLTMTPDVNGKPILNPKEWERIKAHNWRERYALEQGTLQAMEFGTQLQQAHAQINRSLMADRYPGGSSGILYDKNGNPYAQQNPKTGMWHTFPKEPKEPVAGDVSSLRKRANSVLAGLGQTSEGFMARTNEEQGYMAPDPVSGKLTGEFQKPEKDFDPKTYNAVRFKVGNRTYSMPMNDFDALTRVYPREGDPGYKEPIKVGQPQGGSGRPTYPVNTKARFGNTWKIMTDHGWEVMKDQPQGSAAIGTNTAKTGDEGQ